MWEPLSITSVKYTTLLDGDKPPMTLRYEHCYGLNVGHFVCDIKFTRITQVVDIDEALKRANADDDDDDVLTEDDIPSEIYRGSMLGYRCSAEVVRYVMHSLDTFCKLLGKEVSDSDAFCVGYGEHGPIFYGGAVINDP